MLNIESVDVPIVGKLDINDQADFLKEITKPEKKAASSMAKVLFEDAEPEGFGL